MKYTTKLHQAQYVGKITEKVNGVDKLVNIKIQPKGGELTEAHVDAIKADPYGQELIRKGFLIIDGVKPEDTYKKPAKPVAPAQPTSLDGMTKEQLIAYAAEKKITVPQDGTAEEILTAIKKAEGSNK
jgi:hypothetical protein